MVNYTFGSEGIGSLLKGGRLAVPPNQRPYAWEESHVRDLLQDIAGALNAGDQDYFLGTVVLVQTEEGAPSIADGQQRLATVAIMLARIRDKLSASGRERSARSVDTEFLRTVDRNTENVVARLQLNTQDHEFFVQRILSSRQLDGADYSEALQPIGHSNKRLLVASQATNTFLDELLATVRPEAHAEHLNRIVTFLEKKVSVVVVKVNDEVGAYRIFETLNDRGLRASQADILKNYFFSKAGKRLVEAQTLWNTVTTAVEGLGDDEGDWLITYLRHLWITTHGPTKARELAALIKGEITSEAKTMDFLANAAAMVQDYVALWTAEHAKWDAYPAGVKGNIETIAKHLQVEQIRPLLFAVARHFTPQEAAKAFRLFVSWSVRFLIYGGRGGLLDTQYSLRAQDVGTKKITKARELREAMKNYVPSDKEFQEAFATARVSRAHLARYYLRALEKTKAADPQPEYVLNEEVQDINLEHIVPNTPSNAWKIDAEVAEAAQRMLGNMVLLKADKNRDLGNKAFSEKKKIYGESKYLLTSELKDCAKWDIDTIRTRQQRLAEIAVKTWPLTFGD